MLKVLSNILCDSKVKVIGQKASICNCVPTTSALVCIFLISYYINHILPFSYLKNGNCVKGCGTGYLPFHVNYSDELVFQQCQECQGG